MRTNRVVSNVEPGNAELEWEGDSPILVLVEHRRGIGDDGTRKRRQIVTRVKLESFMVANVARKLHEVRMSLERRAQHIAIALKGS